MEKTENSREPLRWGQTPTHIGQKLDTSPRPPVNPTPTCRPPQPLPRPERDTRKYNGFQQAAIKAGLSPDHPGVENMTFDQMKEAAHRKMVGTTRAAAEKAGVFFGPQNEIYHRSR